jgi:hypothetical protein
MKNADMPASPTNLDITEYAGTIDCPYNQPMTGLTKRESFAKDMPHIDVEFGDINEMCKLVEKEEVPISTLDILALSFEVEAKIRVMRADALLNELSKGEL